MVAGLGKLPWKCATPGCIHFTPARVPDSGCWLTGVDRGAPSLELEVLGIQAHQVATLRRSICDYPFPLSILLLTHPKPNSDAHTRWTPNIPQNHACTTLLTHDSYQLQALGCTSYALIKIFKTNWSANAGGDRPVVEASPSRSWP